MDNLVDGFDEESMKLWNSIGSDEEYKRKFEEIAEKAGVSVVSTTRNKKEITISRKHLKDLMDNSLVCAEEAKKLMKGFVETQQYFKANEVRVLGILHKSFADRLQKILNGQDPFGKR